MKPDDRAQWKLKLTLTLSRWMVHSESLYVECHKIWTKIFHRLDNHPVCVKVRWESNGWSWMYMVVYWLTTDDSPPSSHKAYHVISMLSDVNLRQEVVAESDVFVENCPMWTHDNICTTLSPSMMWYDMLKMTNLYLIDWEKISASRLRVNARRWWAWS